MDENRSDVRRSCTILYRTYGGENNAPRPTWYSKQLCLRSILAACERASDAFDIQLTVLHDGELSTTNSWHQQLRRLAEPRGDIVELRKTTNAQSCLDAVRRASALAGDEFVLLSEDDYLWLPSSITGIFGALGALPGDYVTGYDHPVRYQPDYPLGADCEHWHTTIHLHGERHWRSQESTCMTFATTARTLREDLPYFERYHDNGKNTPNDRELFRDLGGLGMYTTTERKRRLLLGPMPSLSTHAHLPWLAPLIDWDAAAAAVTRGGIS